MVQLLVLSSRLVIVLSFVVFLFISSGDTVMDIREEQQVFTPRESLARERSNQLGSDLKDILGKATLSNENWRQENNHGRMNRNLRSSMSAELDGLQQHDKRQMIAPGYYEAECSEKKRCKEGKYCNLLYCEDCHKDKTACTRKEQCCKGMVCTYGRCEKKSKGDPGTFCEKDSDCKADACCVLEPTVNSILPICKTKLAEYHQCASILYRKIWVGEKPDCGPCEQGLDCTQKGYVDEVILNKLHRNIKTVPIGSRIHQPPINQLQLKGCVQKGSK